IFALYFVAVSLLALGIENNLYLVGGVVAFMVILILLGKKNWQRISFFALMGAIIIAYSYSLDFVVSKLPTHQQNRIMVLFNPDLDRKSTRLNSSHVKISY